MAKSRRMSVVDRIGERHGRLVVVERAENKVEPSGSVRARWKCVCDCGGEITTLGHSLSRGLTQSCGCLMREKESKHGKARSKIYRIWTTMKQRCTNPENPAYPSYGGRGIGICAEWLSFEAFYQDMGDAPVGMTLERKDNEKGYEPGNVIWASRLTQANNRRTNILLTYAGRTLTAADWGRETGLGKGIITQRIGRGWSVARILTEPLQDTGKRRRKLKKP